MKNKTFILFLLGAFCLSWATTVASDKPNVIIVMTDDQGYGDLSIHGNPVLKTPFLDRLAQQSVRLDDFHTQPVCAQTRGQLLSGRDALANGCHNVVSGWSMIREGLPTMGEMFQQNGYATGHFGKWHLGENHPYRPEDLGFEDTIRHTGWGILATSEYWYNDNLNDHYWHNGAFKQFEGYATDIFFEYAKKAMLKAKKEGKPFLSYIATNAPHGPFWVPEKYKEAYPGIGGTAGFFGMIANIDENMAKLEDFLVKHGLRENTIVIYMSDNGSAGGQRIYNAGMRGNKKSFYEGGHRVIGFVRWPDQGWDSGRIINSPTQVQDILPTLVEACGLEMPTGTHFDGTSLIAALSGKAQPELKERKLVVQSTTWADAELTFPNKWEGAIIWGKWRYLFGKELYDIEKDPGQQTDVAAKHPEIVAEIREFYEDYWAKHEPFLRDPHYISIGHPSENPTLLTSHDWAAAHTASRSYILEGKGVSGPFYIDVKQGGAYSISLRRWPQETHGKISGALPPFEGELGHVEAGTALPITSARLQIGDQYKAGSVSPDDEAVTFTMDLHKGRTQLQSWFYDKDDNMLCGAYYVEVLKL